MDPFPFVSVLILYPPHNMTLALNVAVLLARYVFWVDCCEPPHIGRIGMDGRGQTVIIDTEIYSPTALTIDYTSKRLYWADDNHILLANMDGTQRRKGGKKVSSGFKEDVNMSGKVTSLEA